MPIVMAARILAYRASYTFLPGAIYAIHEGDTGNFWHTPKQIYCCCAYTAANILRGVLQTKVGISILTGDAALPQQSGRAALKAK